MTTMESSTTRPAAMAKAPSVTRLRLMPCRCITMMPTSRLAGIEMPVTKVGRTLSRNPRITKMARTAPSATFSAECVDGVLDLRPLVGDLCKLHVHRQPCLNLLQLRQGGVRTTSTVLSSGALDHIDGQAGLPVRSADDPLTTRVGRNVCAVDAGNLPQRWKDVLLHKRLQLIRR